MKSARKCIHPYSVRAGFLKGDRNVNADSLAISQGLGFDGHRVIVDRYTLHIPTVQSLAQYFYWKASVGEIFKVLKGTYSNLHLS